MLNYVELGLVIIVMCIIGCIIGAFCCILNNNRIIIFPRLGFEFQESVNVNMVLEPTPAETHNIYVVTAKIVGDDCEVVAVAYQL